ncbi:hypothetical protein JCM10908_004668 [Rhodotorula pacifica]|uniref:uncharacterized protein n=1 Tax=Rhodotorula pacifica TaxID=1495444 RepID=UPI003177069C
MPFRAPPPSQHPSILAHGPTSPTSSSPSPSHQQQQRDSSTTPLRNVLARHATLRLPKPPPPPKPLYLTVRAGPAAGNKRGSDGVLDGERPRGSGGVRKRGGSPSWRGREGVAQGLNEGDGSESESEEEDDRQGVENEEEGGEEGEKAETGAASGGAEKSEDPAQASTSLPSTSDETFGSTPIDIVIATTARSRASYRDPSFTSTTTSSSGIFSTPVGTLRLERPVDVDGRRYSTIRFRDEAGQLNIFFDPRLHNPFSPPAAQEDELAEVAGPTEETASLSVAEEEEMDLTADAEPTDHSVVHEEIGAEETPEGIGGGSHPSSPIPIASLDTFDESTLLPLPAQAQPALALHAFSGLSEHGELSFKAGDELRIEIEDVGGGWSLGYLAQEGEAARGLIPRAWFAYVDVKTASPSREGSIRRSGRDGESAYATRSIGRHDVVSGTEFEPTWIESSPPIPVHETANSKRYDPSGLFSPDDRDATSTDSLSAPQRKATAAELGHYIPTLDWRSSVHFGATLLSAVGSTFSFTLPFSFGGLVVPGASILAATSAPTFNRDSIARPARLPRPEENPTAAKRQDSKALLLRWIEEGDECDQDLDEMMQTWDITDGPLWKVPATAAYEVSVHNPVVTDTEGGESQHVLYSVSTRFRPAADHGSDGSEDDTIEVARRFSDFAALDDLLRARFFHPLIPIADLPTRGELSFGSARFDPAYIDRRSRLLSEWLATIARHPVLGESEELKGFLTLESREELSRHLLRTAPRLLRQPQPLFPARVFHPEFNIDAQDANMLPAYFAHYCDQEATQRLVELQSAAQNAKVAMQKQRDALTHVASCALGCLPERHALDHSVRLTRFDTAPRFAGAFDDFAQLFSNATPQRTRNGQALLDMHRAVLARFQELSREAEHYASLLDRLNRCDTLLNITSAEINRTIREYEVEVAEAVRVWLSHMVAQQEEVGVRMLLLF